MNLAFPALLVFLLVLPGIIFRYAYARGSWGWASPTSLRSTSDEVAYGVVFAAILHVPWALVAACVARPIDFASLLALLVGNFGHESQYFAHSIRSVADHPGAIATYFLTLYVIAALLGNRAHAVVRHLKLDRTTQILRFKNEWYYLLTGEALSFKESTSEVREIDGVYLSGIIEHGGTSYLYRGVVEDFSFDREGQLDTVRLRGAHRRRIADDRTEPLGVESGTKVPPDDRYYDIHGDLFIARYAELKTLNLDYFSITSDKKTTPLPVRTDSGVHSPARRPSRRRLHTSLRRLHLARRGLIPTPRPRRREHVARDLPPRRGSAAEPRAPAPRAGH